MIDRAIEADVLYQNSRGRLTSKNSPFRHLVKDPIQKIARYIPLSADTISIGGFFAATAGEFVATYLNTHNTGLSPLLRKFTAFGLVVGPQVMDSFDGPKSVEEKEKRLSLANDPEVARYSEEEIERSARGGRLDNLMDKLFEATSPFFRAYEAYKREDIVGEAAAYLKAITNLLPARQRALAEKKGKIVQEFVLGPQVLGHRPTRAIAEGVSAAFSEHQAKIDLSQSGSNLLSAANRTYKAYFGKPIQSKELLKDPEERFEAEVRERLAPLKIQDIDTLLLATSLSVPVFAYFLRRKII